MGARRANSSGGICKLKGNRRNRYRVRVTEKWEVDEEKGKVKQVLKVLGDFPTRVEAEKALDDYLACLYDLKHKDITFEKLCEEWVKWYFETRCKKPNSQRTITSSY